MNRCLGKNKCDHFVLKRGMKGDIDGECRCLTHNILDGAICTSPFYGMTKIQADVLRKILTISQGGLKQPI
jgi:hypothetical protein